MPSSANNPPKAKKKGLFLDEDCERPACDDIQKSLPKSMEELQAMTAKNKQQQQKKKVECPPRTAELGRSSWKLLHSMVRTSVRYLCIDWVLVFVFVEW
jgi:hypothetical protein